MRLLSKVLVESSSRRHTAEKGCVSNMCNASGAKRSTSALTGSNHRASTRWIPSTGSRRKASLIGFHSVYLVPNSQAMLFTVYVSSWSNPPRFFMNAAT